MTNTITTERYFEIVASLVEAGRVACNQPGVSGAEAAKHASMRAAVAGAYEAGIRPGYTRGVDVPGLFHHVAQGLGWRDTWDASYRVAMPYWLAA